MVTSKRIKKHRKRRTLKRVLHVGGNTKIKLFDLDLHPSVIEDVKSVLNTIYPDKFDLTVWSLAEYKHQYGRDQMKINHINANTWKNIDMKMIEDFQNEYDSELKQYDGFIVTHSPVFAMIYEKYNKPIIVVNSCRFNQPFCWNKDNNMLTLFTDALKRMQNNKQLVIISNNKADQSYLKRTAEINSEYIPSLCMYTNAKYNPIKNNFVFFENQYTKNNINKFKSLNSSKLIVNRPKDYTFKDLFEYKGIIHLPYDISSMGLFEQYFAGVALFFPEKDFYKKCIQDNIAQFIVRYDTWTDLRGDISIPSSDEIDMWLKDADYYNFKYINYYTSFQDCIDKIKSFTDENKNKRLKHIENVKKESLDKWRQIINNIFKIQSGGNITEENQCKYISSRGVLKSCNIYSKNYSNKDFNSYTNMNNIKDGNSIFIRSSNFKEFINYFNKIVNKVILVVGDDDDTFPKDFWANENDFKTFIENPNIIRIFAINVNTTHPKLIQYPIGINYHTLSGDKRTNNNKNWGNNMSIQDQENEIEEIRNKGLPFDKRKIKAYSNFHFHMEQNRTYTQDRRDAKTQILAECIDYEKNPVARRQTYLNQIEYAYVVCPHGNGLDCHRQWEALILGCIPIVKTSSIDVLYEDLPVLIVNQWTDITKELLELKIKEFKNKTFNYDKLLLKYWIDKINRI